MGSREEALEAENGRLQAEMASLKKKIMLALKKQQAELQAKIHAAEQRALAAEAAISSSPNSPSKFPSSTAESHNRSDVEVDSYAGEYSNGESLPETSTLQSELETEKSLRIRQQEDFNKEISRLQTELHQLHEQIKQKDEPNLQLQESQRRIDELSKVNEKMETQLLSAAQQVSDACSQNANMHENMENISKERDTAKLSYERLREEYDRVCKVLVNAKEDLSLKSKEMEALMASHKATQEGQEAAMVHLMQQMQAMEASTTAQSKEAQQQNLYAEKIEEQKRTIELLQEELLQFKRQHNLVTSQVEDGRTPMPSSAEIALLKESKNNLEKELSVARSLLEEHENVTRNFETQIKERDEKYAELDSKFNRLQKRAKQRIQEVQKEKEEMEVQLKAAQEKQTSFQSELDRFRAQAGDAIRALDAERQNLRNSNSKLKEEVEELKRTLAAKEHNLEESRRLASEKDQTALSMHAEMEAVKEKHTAVLSELEDKHKKALEVLQNQLSDATMEMNKQVESVNHLQALLVQKESKLTEMEATLTGEVARLSAAIEAEKKETLQLREIQENERRKWRNILTDMESKNQQLENAYHQLEHTFSESKREFELELDTQRQSLMGSQKETGFAKDEAARVSKEFAAYKVRAHALLQKKEAELQAAKDADLAAAQEAILKDAQKQAAVAVAERDRAVSSLKHAVTEYETQLAARNVAVVDAEQRIKDLATKLESVKGLLTYEREEWQKHTKELESSWQKKYEELVKKQDRPVEDSVRSELSTLQSEYELLKGDYDGFREMATKMMEAKDQEINKLLDHNNSLQNELQSRQQPNEIKKESKELEERVPVIAVAEQQILLLARQQAQREEELKQCQRQIQVLQEELSELEHENRLHTQQETMLKEEFRNMERAAKRETVDMTYLKNVILKLLETGEVEALLPVVGTLLQFSPEELKHCQEAYGSGASESPASTPRLLLSRLSFSSTR